MHRIGMATVALGLALAAPLAAQAHHNQTAVLAGGCFWGIQNVFEHVRGGDARDSGFSGGHQGAASYEDVSSGTTGHAEAVKIEFDPAVVSYGTLLRVFFLAAHDPTQLNRQGPDVGTNYRSAIFFANEDQHRVAQALIDSLTRTRTFAQPIVTQVAPFGGFFAAEEYHQDYAIRHPLDPYIVINDRPKVGHLRDRFPELFVEEAVRYSR